MTQSPEFKTITVKGITYIGRRQIEAEYALSRNKAHQILVASEIIPIKYFNILLYDEKNVTAHMESIYVFKADRETK